MQTAAAPELHPSLEWLNAPAQSVGAQHGRVLLLAFWSAGSAYSHNLLDELRFVQARHPVGLRVFAIHVPKFEAERQARTVQKTVNRLGLGFPVAHDPDFVAWQHYGILAWPSVAVLDTEGRLRQVLAGDGQAEVLDMLTGQLLEEAAETPAAPEAAEPARGTEPRMPLAFPCGIAANDSHLYVADTGHHRILECTHEGRVLREFGTGHADLIDGPSHEAAFRFPRGLALLRDALYVADAGNHALRRVRLLDGEVETLAGNGRAGWPEDGVVSDARAVSLNQPWAVAAAFDQVYIAMAGCNQVWAFDLGRNLLRCVAGSGELGLVDGSGEQAAFAHPAALALVQQTLYVCDAAGSALRSVQVGSGQVQTLVGHGLFDFGDRDGERREARLQYPLGLALDPGAPVLWVADSYNGALKRLRLGGGELKGFELNARLHQPAALATGAGALWVANTDAHEILRIDTDRGEARHVPVAE